jgi:adiponectin receptor
MEEKNNSQNLLEEEKQNESEDSNSLIKSKELDLEKEFDLTLGTFEEAEKFMQDNEYIREGYILNCNTFKRTLRSLLMIHNETVNVWSHLVGAIFFFFLIWYTTIFITNLQTQVSNIRSDASLVANKAREFKEESSDIMKNVYTSMKEIEYNFKNFYNAEKEEETTVYIRAFNEINYIYGELKNYSLPVMVSAYKKIKEYYTYFMDAVTSVKEEIIDLIKLDTSLTQEYETHLDTNYHLNLEERKKKELARWPLYIIIFSAIFCLSFSAIFHLFGVINEKYFNILNRFDYGGISLLISGSCFPPYYYFFYYSTLFKYLYLILISVFGVGTFLYSLTDDFNKPKRRALRGTLFLIFGLCSGVPIMHMAFFGDYIEGYGNDIILLNWYLGGISYIIGALFYILRFPEKKFPGKFDYFGASHQIFHVLVFFGALFHFIGSLEAYNYRFRNLKIN